MVFRRIEGKLFIVQRRFVFTPLRSPSGDFTVRGSKRLSRTDISFAKVSSIVKPCRASSPFFAQANASIIRKSDRRGWYRSQGKCHPMAQIQARLARGAGVVGSRRCSDV